MKVLKYPKRDEWAELIRRPLIEPGQLASQVASIMDAVRLRGDAAIREFSIEFDKVAVADLAVSDHEFLDAERSVPEPLKAAIASAKSNIVKFHQGTQQLPTAPIETQPGVMCWTRNLPIERVGLYIPAGSAPLFSTVLMLAVPAKLAGCSQIVMCSPTGADGTISAATLYAASLCGVKSVYKVGGAQAIAAMTYGTETIPSLFKIFGPGNQYVTEAKIQAMRSGIAIDMPAGPSELAVIADDSSVPAFVAADLLSQAEHGTDSQVILAATSEGLITEVLEEIDRQLRALPRSQIARGALENSRFVLLSSTGEAIDLINEYAPEHLIIATEDADMLSRSIVNAGSVFIGTYSCESAGDYASGTNHTLPTGGTARSFSGVSVANFTKTVTFQKLSGDGLLGLADVIETMAAAEGLDGHRSAVAIRREYLGG